MNVLASLPMYTHVSTAIGTKRKGARPTARCTTYFLSRVRLVCSALAAAYNFADARAANRCNKFEPRLHHHSAAPALAFNQGRLTGQESVATFRPRLAAAGRGDQAQGVCQVIMAHLVHLGYLLADHRRMICFRW